MFNIIELKKRIMKFLAIISGLIAALMVSLMLSGCSQKGENISNNEPQVQPEQVSKQDDTPTKLILIALPATQSDNKSAGVKENKKKTNVKTEEPKVPEIKTEDTNKNPRLADDSAMDPKNKFPDDYNGK